MLLSCNNQDLFGGKFEFLTRQHAKHHAFPAGEVLRQGKSGGLVLPPDM